MSASPRLSLSDRLDSLLMSSDSDKPSEPPVALSTTTQNKSNAPELHPNPLKSKGPVLRWLSSWSPTTRSQANSPSHSPAHSNHSTPPPSPALASLSEALHEPIIQKPPKARLPESFFPHTHPPAFFDNLTRSTLPTASLAPPLSVKSSHAPREPSTACHNPNYSPPILLNSSPPTRKSLDTLRSVSSREHHRTGSINSVSTPSPTSQFFGSGWGWLQSNNKDEGGDESLLGQEDRGDTAEEEQRKLRKRYRTPGNPIVFCHGLLGFDSVSIGPSIAPLQVSHWRGIQEVLLANGAEVLITRVPATSSPLDRAKVLEEKIEEAYPGRSIHLIGHSMGGLDCRLLAHRVHQQKDRKFNVLSVTTIATPHRGSSFADYFLETVGKDRMPQVLNLLNMLPNGGGDGKAFEFLTLDNVRRFNEQTPDVEGVHYFSWGASYEPGLIDTWKWPHSIILEREGPNDGLVSVASSRWGKYLGTLSDVNHLDLVGWINTARYKWAEMTGREIKFHPATFYLTVCDMLAREVEGIWRDPSEANTAGSSESDLSTKGKAERGVHLVENESSHSTSDDTSPGQGPSQFKEASQKNPSASNTGIDSRTTHKTSDSEHALDLTERK